jgi:hypothetical protein
MDRRHAPLTFSRSRVVAAKVAKGFVVQGNSQVKKKLPLGAKFFFY